MHSQTPHRPQLPTHVPQPPAEPPPTRLAGTQGPWLRWLHSPFMRGPWGRVLKIGAGVAGVLALLLVAVNLVISADWVQARVAARIKEQTGRDLTVDGSTMLLFAPGPRVVITDAKLTDPDPNARAAEISVARLTLDLNFSDLLSRKVDAERVVLMRPVLTLRFGGDAPAMRWGQDTPKPTKIRFAKAQAAGGPEHRAVHLNDLRIKNGTVVILYDEDARNEKRVERINARLSLPDLAAPLVGSGSFEWKKETVEFSFEVTTPADLRAARPAKLLAAFDTQALAARFDGSLATKPALTGQGQLSAKASSIPSVLAWLRETPEVSSALGDGELASAVSWNESEITFDQVRFALEHASGVGRAAVTLRSPRPHVRAAFALDHLDLNPFLASGQNRAALEPPVRAAALATPKAKPAADPVDWFTKPEGPVVVKAVSPPPSALRPVQAAAAAEALESPDTSRPDTPQPTLAALPADEPAAAPAAFDADVNLNVRKSRVGHLDIGPSSLGLGFRDGVLTATLGGMELYDGHATGTLVIDAAKPVPSFEGNLRLEGVQARPLLSDAAQFSMIAGRTKLTLDIGGAGEDADQIKSSLHGQGSFVVSDGSLGGIDITAFISALGQGNFDLRQGPDARTAFSDLGGSFTISDGIAETHNLQMVSPLLKVTAEGTVDIARSNLDIVAHPQVIAGPEGKGGANDLAGLTVPVRVEGPLDNPSIRPQVGAVFADPENASKTVNKIGEAIQKKFKGKPVGEAIGRILGNVRIGRGGDDKPAPNERRAAPSGGAEANQDDPDEITDPDLQEILR